MANELVHGTVGAGMTQAEFEAVGLHVLNSQATGDLIYASSATQLSRLAIGAADTVLTCNGTIPSWSATPILNTAVAKGTWTASGTWTIPAVTLGGTVTINSQVLDAGAGRLQLNTTAGTDVLRLQSTNNDSYGAAISFFHISTTPAVADRVTEIDAYGRDAVGVNALYGRLSWQITNITDTTEASKLVFRLHDAGAENVAMELTGAGVLSVDLAGVGTAAQVDLFDKYDDALVLRQGIQQNNRELLADIGVLTRKDTGSGFMLNLQPMIRLLAGGIYQDRQLIEDMRDELLDRVALLENKIKLLGG